MQSNHIYSILGLGLVVGLALCLYLRNLKVVPFRHSDSCVSFRAHVRFAPLYPVTEVLPSRQFAISKMSISPTTVASFLIVRLLIDNNCLLFWLLHGFIVFLLCLAAEMLLQLSDAASDESY